MLREKIKKEIQSQGLSVYRLAKLSGLQITQINGYLKAKNGLTSESIEKILKALDVIEVLFIFKIINSDK